MSQQQQQLFTIFKNHSGDHIIYDKKANIFYKHALPQTPPLTLSEFKSCLTNIVILRDENCDFFYDELTESAKSARPDNIPKNYNQEEFYIQPYLSADEVCGLDHAQFLTNPASFYSLAQLSDYLTDSEIGHVLTNFLKQNELRIKHDNTPPLVLDSELCSLARQRLEMLLVDSSAEQNIDFVEYGENVYVHQAEESNGLMSQLGLEELGIEFDEEEILEPPSGREIAEIWYNEIENYRIIKNPNIY